MENNNTIFYNKLVRDKIPDVIQSHGDSVDYRKLSYDEYVEQLDKKLAEEVEEYLQSGCMIELADIEEVLRAILEAKGVSYKSFETIREEKANTRGSFNNRIYLKSVTSANK